MAVLPPQLAGDGSWLAAQTSETIVVNNSQPSVHMIQPNRQENQPWKRFNPELELHQQPIKPGVRGKQPWKRSARKAQETVKTTFGRISLALKHNIPRKPL